MKICSSANQPKCIMFHCQHAIPHEHVSSCDLECSGECRDIDPFDGMEKSALIDHIKELQTEVLRLKDIKLVHFNNDECWLWEGDGYDFPESLVCPVVMSADTLRALLNKRDEHENQ